MSASEVRAPQGSAIAPGEHVLGGNRPRQVVGQDLNQERREREPSPRSVRLGLLDVSELSTDLLEDQDIPPLCKSLRVSALITANYKDFGARKVYYQSLLAAGVSVVVIRPGKGRFTPEQQTSIITRHLSRIRQEVESADTPILVKVTQSDVAPRSLDELVEEFESGRGKLP